MFSVDDTIVAVATPGGHGGIGVVRLSGSRSVEIATALTEDKVSLAPRHATFARLTVARNAADQVILTFFPGPRSYTGEDVVEISAHGSPVLLRAIVDAAMERGARLAEPGEVLPAGVPAITVGDERRPWVRVYVGQGILPTLKLGDTVTAVLDDFPDREFPGAIVALATKAEFTPRVALTERERADLLFGVKVQFVDTSAMLKPGVPVTVRFRAKG